MELVFIAGPMTTGGDGSKEYITKNIQIAEQYTVALANVGIGFFARIPIQLFITARAVRRQKVFIMKWISKY